MEAKTQKSEMTRAAIVDAALAIATHQGLQAVSMQAVADRLHISKSGVFSRSGSLEALQLAVMEEYGRRFLADIFLPAMQKPLGLPRLDAMVLRWLERVCSQPSLGASIFESTAFSLHPLDQAIHGVLAQGVLGWRGAMRRTIVQCVEQGQLHANCDPDLLLYEIHSLVLGALYDAGFLRERKTPERARSAYERLMACYRT